MHGPFQPKDLVARYFRNAAVGDLLLGENGLVMAAHIPTLNTDVTKDVLVQFAPTKSPTVIQAWLPDERCLAIATGGRYEPSVGRTCSKPGPDCLGIDISGDIALTIIRGSGTGFLELGRGVVTSQEPPGYVWCSSWRLELVLGDARVLMGDHP